MREELSLYIRKLQRLKAKLTSQNDTHDRMATTREPASVYNAFDISSIFKALAYIAHFINVCQYNHKNFNAAVCIVGICLKNAEHTTESALNANIKHNKP